jgi:23S rRNA pseudouridine2605 synthase
MSSKSKSGSSKSELDTATKVKKPKAKSKAPSAKRKTAAAKTRKPKVMAKDKAIKAGGIQDPIESVGNIDASLATGEPVEPVVQVESVASGSRITKMAGAKKEASRKTISATKDEAVAKDEDGQEENEEDREPRPPGKLERLQKILSQAGVASRRHAEEMIVAGRVMVNGQVITQLGAKADAAQDHIRVDGKLLQGAERHRYFVLNKPRGYVTTVSDPEGRPTVMEFFAKMGERLYPVGRLDYLSEGLLLVTNDGALANQLTRASLGVEKTYLVKVAGQPTEEELDILRGGVAIERGAPGSPAVRTAPAQVRQIRQGDNPWYEVVLTEGRNRELRKMFSAIGHFVEKIRRVGYGPLVLDVEPGKLRELAPEELTVLRLTADGKIKPRRLKTAKMLPKEAGRTVEERGIRPPVRAGKPLRKMAGEGETRSHRPQEQRFDGSREGRTFGRGAKPGFSRQQGGGTNAKPRFDKPRDDRFGAKPRFERTEGGRPGERAGRFGAKPGQQRPFRGKPESAHAPRPRFDRPAQQDKPRFDRPVFTDRPRRNDTELRIEAQPPGKPFSPRRDRPAFQRAERPAKPFRKAPSRTFGKETGKSWSKGPAKPWSEGPYTRPAQTEGSAPVYRANARPGGFSKPGFNAKSGGARPGGFSKSGYKGKPSGAKRTGPRPSGKGYGGKKRG